jgi:hypothetical protein
MKKRARIALSFTESACKTHFNQTYGKKTYIDEVFVQHAIGKKTLDEFNRKRTEVNGEIREEREDSRA